jgi:hypothetical protein
MHLIADYYGFRPEWDIWTSEHQHLSQQEWLFQALIFKGTFMNTGRAPDALCASPCEGMHRTVAGLCMHLCTSPSTYNNLLRPPFSLKWEDFIEVGCMKPFPDGYEDVSIRDANDKFVWQSPLHPVTVETFYFNVDPSEASSEELCKSARMDSEERSESKHSSIKPQPLSLMYNNTVERYSAKMTEEHYIAEPQFPETSTGWYSIANYKDCTDAKAIKGLLQGNLTEDDALGIPLVLTTSTSKAFFKDALSHSKQQAYLEQFRVDVAVEGRTVTLTPPFMFSKKSLFDCPLGLMSSAHQLVGFFYGIITHTWFKSQGCPDAGHPRDSKLCHETTMYGIKHLSILEAETQRRMKTHAVIGEKYPCYGSGPIFTGNKSLIGGLFYIAELLASVWYEHTSAKFPFQKNSAGDIVLELPTILSVKQHMRDKITQAQQAFGRFHMVSPGVPAVDLIKQLCEFQL